ncbi:PREDICTED: coiled-coil domain-containing protein 42B [Gekko japonicus]|uniref:Coiled-coil domain-containing protein 42B n=1 Tax=Gekko japonicus TaxID=146911 RepID=A0ABM1L492_GEKJA|nr:PREDICTED: coiled-coil domain-containing protein 42B [Gekko japonicus]
MATERCAARLRSNGQAGLARLLGERLASCRLPRTFATSWTGAGVCEKLALWLSEERWLRIWRLRAAFNHKLLLVKIPEKEDDLLPAGCCLLEKRRELAEVEQALSAQKEEFQMKMERLQHRQQELESKEKQLKEAVLKFDKFLKDSDAKRSRALRKAEEEQQQAAQRGVEVEHLRQETARLLSLKEKLQQRLEAHKAFPEYLQKVVDKAEQFQEIPELISRFQTLIATQAKLIQRELVNREAMEEEHARLQKYVEESSNQILRQNNQIAQLQAQLEQAQIRVHEGESVWNRIQNTAAEKTLEVGQIKLAALNLFQMVAKHRKLPANVAQEDTEAQLDAVKLCMVDLINMLADFRKGDPPSVPQPERTATPQSELNKTYPTSRHWVRVKYFAGLNTQLANCAWLGQDPRDPGLF